MRFIPEVLNMFREYDYLNTLGEKWLFNLVMRQRVKVKNDNNIDFKEKWYDT